MVATRRAAAAAEAAAAVARQKRQAAAAAAAASAAGSNFSVSSASSAAASGAKAAASGGSATASAQPGSERIVDRSLFIHVRPAPTSMSERRSVLRVLERYGKTEMFKKMAANDSFVAITSTAAMAKTLIRRSPMQYEFLGETLQAVRPWGRPGVAAFVHPVETSAGGGSSTEAADQQQPQPQPSTEPTDATSSSSSSSSSSTSTHPPRPPVISAVAHKSFVLSIFPSVEYHHLSMVRKNPLHGPWPSEYGDPESSDDPSSSTRTGTGTGTGTGTSTNTNTNSGGSFVGPLLSSEGSPTYKNTFVYNALRAVVPAGAAAEALCDWRDPETVKLGVAAAAGARPSALTYILQRKARKELGRHSLLSNLANKSARNGSHGSSSGSSNTRRSFDPR